MTKHRRWENLQAEHFTPEEIAENKKKAQQELEKSYVPISQFAADPDKYIKQLKKRKRITVSKDGKAYALIISPEEYERLLWIENDLAEKVRSKLPK